jgi:hypothetical protein
MFLKTSSIVPELFLTRSSMFLKRSSNVPVMFLNCSSNVPFMFLQVLHGVLVNELAADPESLLLLMRLVDDVLGCARREFSDWQQSLQVWRTDASVLTQPKVAALYAAGQNGKKYAGKLHKARPRWLVLERAFLTNQWRASQVCNVL